jgi:hypothetical protein
MFPSDFRELLQNLISEHHEHDDRIEIKLFSETNSLIGWVDDVKNDYLILHTGSEIIALPLDFIHYIRINLSHLEL